jgi:hypothetical protein
LTSNPRIGYGNNPHPSRANRRPSSQILATLDEETCSAFHAGKRQKIPLDFVIEEPPAAR